MYVKLSVTVAVLLAVLGGGCQKPVRPQAYQPEMTAEQYRRQLPIKPVGQLTIGAWNLYYLGSPEQRDEPDVAKDVAAMARYIADSQVDVLALSEVNGDDSLRSPDLERIIEHLGPQWQYRLFGQNIDLNECTGVLWNTSRVSLAETVELPVDRDPPGWQQFERQERPAELPSRPERLHRRKVYAAHFTTGPGRTDFVVVPLHMRSSQGGFHRSRVQRYFEMATILDALPGLTFGRGEYDVILIGDINSLGQSAESFVLSSGEVVSAPDYATGWGDPAYFRQLGDDDDNTILKRVPGTGWGNQAAPLDRAYVPRYELEFAASQWHVHDDVRQYADNTRDFMNRLSDHLLVYTTIWIGEDDD